MIIHDFWPSYRGACYSAPVKEKALPEFNVQDV